MATLADPISVYYPMFAMLIPVYYAMGEVCNSLDMNVKTRLWQ